MSLTAITNTSGFRFRGAWSSSTSYVTNDVVLRNDSTFAALKSNLNVDPYADAGSGGTNWSRFAEGLFYRGTYSSLTTYQLTDVVTFSSQSYISLQDGNLNNTPSTSPTFWSLIAAQGQVAPRQIATFNMPSAPITSVTVASNVVTLACANSFQTHGEGTGQGQVNTIFISGLTNATFLNGQVLTISTISGTQITANFTHANYGPTAEPTGTATLSIPIGGVFWTTITLAPTFEVSFISCGQANRIELYSTAAARTADASRPATTQPAAGTQHGVILDLNLDGVQASFSSWVLSPLSYGAVADNDTNNIWAALTNIGGSATTNLFSIMFTFTYEETSSGIGSVPASAADKFVLGAADTTNLPASVGNPTAYFGVSTAPNVAGSLDDEFPGSSLDNTRWTFANQGTAVTAVAKSILTISDSPQGSTQIVRYVYQTAPSTPWQVTAGPFHLTEINANFAGAGLAIQDGNTNKAILWHMQINTGSGTGETLALDNFTDLNTFAGGSATFAAPIPWSKVLYLQIKDDGVNHTFYFSENGLSFYQVWQQSRTAFLTTTNRVGVFLYPNAAASAGSSTSFPITTMSVGIDFFRRTL